MLGTDDMQEMFGSILSGVYEEAELEYWTQSLTREADTGLFPFELSGSEYVMVQREECTQEQKGWDGYQADDVRFLILQECVTGTLDLDCRLIYRGEKYRVFQPVLQDPMRVYWDVRARRMTD